MSERISPGVAKAIYERTQQDPEWFMREVLGEDLWQRQIDILDAIRHHDEVAVKSCHGIGKSFTVARIVLWYLIAHPGCIIITTAPTDRQVRGILWKEIAVAYNNATRRGFPLGGRLLTQELEMAPKWMAMGFTSSESDVDRFVGWHADAGVLVVLDEACGISETIFDKGVAGLMTGNNCKTLAISNPTNPDAPFAKMFEKDRVKKITVSAFDTPNFTEFGITQDDIASGKWKEKASSTPRPYLVTPKWVASRYEDWGPESPTYISKVLGQFPKLSEDSFISADAVKNLKDNNLIKDSDDSKILGVDVARFGPDYSVGYVNEGGICKRLFKKRGLSVTELVRFIIQQVKEHNITEIRIDADGLGAGVYDQLFDEFFNTSVSVIAMHGGKKAFDSERFANQRAEWYWGFKTLAENEDISLEGDIRELVDQFASLPYKVRDNGQIAMISKQELKRKGRSSPDEADALVYATAKVSRFVVL